MSKDTEPQQTHTDERNQRILNLAKINENGYGIDETPFVRTADLKTIRANFEEGKEIKAAGRLMTIRDMGKSVFADLRDGSDRFQIYLNKKTVSEKDFEVFGLLSPGDMVGVEGELFTTRAGEFTIKITTWRLLAKSILPMPEKWHGLRDTEARYRQRYLDLIVNPEVKSVFEMRSHIIRAMRDYLWENGFLEVETPMMQSVAGGAAARPFETFYTALDSKMYLRIAPELYLKRLLVGGFEKVFELNRNFRNEGLSRNHNPEFTMLEIYQAFSDVRGMMDLIKNLILHTAQTVLGTLKCGTGEKELDLGAPWREVEYRTLIKEKMGDNWFELSKEEQVSGVEKLGLSVDPEWDSVMVTHEIYEKLIEKSLIQPTFVTRFPANLIPLAKTCPDDPTLVNVYELVINGMEVSPGYSELADPIEQRKRFEEQTGEDTHKMDEDFVTALEYGMPPAGGLGMGVDRLVMVLTGSDTIRDVVLFPQMRQKVD
ncbi:MAG: lysine--tRNA ligase [Lentisphaerae bacterium]|nr:lysine--tRNA ligase [Lentisphaerota bacterium]